MLLWREGAYEYEGWVTDHSSWRGRDRGQIRHRTLERVAGTDRARSKGTQEPLKSLSSGVV